MYFGIFYAFTLFYIRGSLILGNGVWASYQAQAERNQTELFIPLTGDEETLIPALSAFYMFWTMIILLQVCGLHFFCGRNVWRRADNFAVKPLTYNGLRLL